MCHPVLRFPIPFAIRCEMSGIALWIGIMNEAKVNETQKKLFDTSQFPFLPKRISRHDSGISSPLVESWDGRRVLWRATVLRPQKWASGVLHHHHHHYMQWAHIYVFWRWIMTKSGGNIKCILHSELPRHTVFVPSNQISHLGYASAFRRIITWRLKMIE